MKTEETQSLKKHSGQVFTPDYLVKTILDEAGYSGESILNRHAIDNSCGDGAFICEMIRRYYDAYKTQYGGSEGLSEALSEYIHGIEIDKTAYLCCIDNINAILNELGIANANIDIRNADTMEIASEYYGRMDYVLGNPPYVRVHNLKEKFDTVKQYTFAEGGMTDIYLVFFEMGLSMLSDNGLLCYITPSSWINSVAGKNMREYISREKCLVSILDLEHYQPFKATTYTMVTTLSKKHTDTFRYSVYDSDNNNACFMADLSYDDAYIAGTLYLADKTTLSAIRKIKTDSFKQYAIVKNGFATLADKVYINDNFPFDDYVIPVIKGSTGKSRKAIFPYDKTGTPVSKENLFSVVRLKEYMESHKEELLKERAESDVPDWYLYGRSQALKDVYKDKYVVNVVIREKETIKLNVAPSGTGVYSGLYILTDIPFETIKEIIISDDFVRYVASLKKYKNSGYYTFNTKDIESYLNYMLNKNAGNV